MKRRLLLAAAVTLSACGGASTSPSTAAVTQYRQAALSASTAVTTYQSSTQTMATPADCQAAAQQYAAQMGAAVAAMRASSGSMDDHMRSMGQPGAADMTCGAEVLATQLQQQMGVACASTDMAQNRAVAAQHCQQMALAADHLQMRAAAMASMMGTGSGATGGGMTSGGGMMGGSGMMSGADMTSAMQGMTDGGFTGPDGQHLAWSDAMPGCTMSGGTYQPAPTDGGTPVTPAG
ncbi:hypothetical protein [Anaeromyxobacter diazotrophicus]|uniref:Lipoprotein n=1 Tax=Anaeromyxobacter diazotrophicus TaxID=2590199 RepID=A0A7I9VRR7_9BACT|nr:hypothetical protein [Anaeromyxobacter diazotrophicus]GEJ59126.1 hypothetical protein AMYX_38670 [Anaeromyxobacter diazotrophicus]